MALRRPPGDEEVALATWAMLIGDPLFELDIPAALICAKSHHAK